MAKTINVDVIDKSVAPKNPVNICIVNKPNPAKNCTVTESQLYRLINMPSYWVYEAGTTNIITGKNFEKYFPSSSGGGTGGPTEAEDVSYDNTKSKIPSLNVQGAIDYLKENGGSGLSLGETNTTAYRGDRGKTAYDHSQLTTGNPHGVTKTDVGLGKVDNTSDADKPISTLQQTEFDKKLDTDKAVGKNVAGQEFTVNGKKVTAGEGAEIFNDYLDNIATGEYSHAEGHNTIATNAWAHAEGGSTRARGYTSHAEGYSTSADGESSHSEGYYTWAAGTCSHSEGRGTTAEGVTSHTEGEFTHAAGGHSHAEGYGTEAIGEAQHVEGKYNIEDTENKFAHIIGNGTNKDKRSNAFAIDWNGNIYVNNSPTGVNVNDLQAASHTHTNKDILDKFSTDEDTNELLFNDTPVIITITVDSALSETSTNPIQNKTVTQQINQLNQRIPTKTSQLSNDKEFQTKEDIDTLLTPYAKTTDIPTVPSKISSFTNDKEYQTKSDVTTILTAYTKTSDLKTKLSQFENDENYIKNTVDNLVNYYTKTETYNKTEVDTLIGSDNNNYQNLENKPTINGVELIGNKTTADLNIVSEKASETVSGTSKMWTTVDETTSKVTLHISTE